MYELIPVSAHDYYVDCPAKIGIHQINETDVVLIDSGSDKDAGKKVLKILQAKGWKLTAILNTHSHADHIGGNRYLQEQTGCKVYARGLECDFAAHPILEPVSLYGGFPLKGLRHKFLLAQESRAELLTEDVLPEGMQMIALPGHSYDMVGFRTADDVVFLADSISSRETLDKYAVVFLTDIEAHLQTLEQLKTMKAGCFVPAHAPAAEEVAELAQYNIDSVMAVGERIVSLCEAPISAEALLKQLCDSYGIVLNLQQYALIGSTMRSYLTWLQNTGRVDAFFEDNQLLWKKQ